MSIVLYAHNQNLEFCFFPDFVHKDTSEGRDVKHQSTFKTPSLYDRYYSEPLHFMPLTYLSVDQHQPRQTARVRHCFFNGRQRHVVKIRSLDGLQLPGRSLNSTSPAPSVVFSVSAHVYSPPNEEEGEEGRRRGLVEDAW